jgi:hypothetical protein
MVDYMNPSITVECWYRVLEKNVSIDQLLQLISQMGFTTERVHIIPVDKIGVSPVFAALQTVGDAFLLCSSFRNVQEAYQHVKLLEEGLKNSYLKVGHETERDAFLKLREGVVKAVLLTPKLSKENVVEIAISGQVFAYKATRHIIPARPLRVNTPLGLLRNKYKTLEEANQEFIKSLQKKTLKYMPAGSLIGGRRYEEDVYLFEG